MSKNAQEKIIKTAEDLLWEQGFEATSVNQLVEQAGLSKGAFFHYYPTKQDLAEDVIEAYFQDHIVEPLKKQLSEATTIKNALLNWIMHWYEAQQSRDFKGGCLMGNMALELADTNEDARARLKQKFLDLENVLVLALRPLDREAKLIMKPRQCARIMIASIQGFVMMGKVHKDQIRSSREFMALAEMIEYLIRD